MSSFNLCLGLPQFLTSCFGLPPVNIIHQFFLPVLLTFIPFQVSELLNRKQPEENTAHQPQTPRVTSTVKSTQNITNINIITKPATSTTSQSNGDFQVFQKGPQVTTLVANLPGMEPRKDPVQIRSRSSMSNVSNTHIPAPGGDGYCHKNHRQKHHRISTKAGEELIRTSHKKHHHFNGREYGSETNASTEHLARQTKKSLENGVQPTKHTHNHHQEHSRTNSEKDYAADISLRASRIVQDLTRHNKDANLYEKHRQKCITASEKYNSDLLRHYNVRKTTSVLDFRSEVQIRPKYADSKSVDELDAIEPNENGKSVSSRRLVECRSVKSLDFDSDTNSVSYLTPSSPKVVDYTSEPLENRRLGFYSAGDRSKPRPTPPKKPIRLSLHKLQNNSLETSSIVSNGSSVKSDYRKPMKRNHKGEAPPVSVTVKVENNVAEQSLAAPEINGYRNCKEGSLVPLKWTSFGQMK